MTAKTSRVLSWIFYVRPGSLIYMYTLKWDDEHPWIFHTRVPLAQVLNLSPLKTRIFFIKLICNLVAFGSIIQRLSKTSFKIVSFWNHLYIGFTKPKNDHNQPQHSLSLNCQYSPTFLFLRIISNGPYLQTWSESITLSQSKLLILSNIPMFLRIIKWLLPANVHQYAQHG